MIPALVIYVVGGIFWSGVWFIAWDCATTWPYAEPEEAQVAALGLLLSPIWPLAIVALLAVTLSEIPAGIRALGKGLKRLINTARGKHLNDYIYY